MFQSGSPYELVVDIIFHYPMFFCNWLNQFFSIKNKIFNKKYFKKPTKLYFYEAQIQYMFIMLLSANRLTSVLMPLRHNYVN